MNNPHGYRTDYRSEGNPQKMHRSDEAVRRLNSLLRGEISAAETYRMAIDREGNSKNPQNARIELLRKVCEEHDQAAQSLRDRIRELGAEASDSSGPWGVWAKFTQGSAGLFGDAAALKSLKEAEMHGLKDYQEAVEAMDATSADLIRNQLVAARQRHIQLLDQLIDSINAA